VLRCRRDPDWPVWDLERLCRVVLDAHVRRVGQEMQPADYDEALGFLLGEGWLLASRYDPARGRVPSQPGSKGSSPSASSTISEVLTGHGESNGSAPASSPSSTAQELLRTGIPWSTLSPRSIAIAKTVGRMTVEGHTQPEIARSPGRSPGWVGEQLAILRRELEQTAG
jgi:hypothetical protein